MLPIKESQFDLRLHYRKTLEIALVASLVLHIGMFRFVPNVGGDLDLNKAVAIDIEVEDIPQTEQVRNLPPPPKPSIPVPTEDEMVPEDLTIETTDLDFSALPPPPPPSEDPLDQGYAFIAYDEPPAPIGGYAAILRNLRYPEIARKSGMEATVLVGVLIGADGTPLKTQIMSPAKADLGFEKAATDAIMATKWRPAKQRDRAIKVWVSVPIRFKLRASSDKPLS